MADKEISSQANQEVVKQGNNEYRRSIQHLPAFYRTDANNRFLSSTLDPFIQKGQLERVDGFIGKQDAYTRKASETYIGATSRDRFSYQLEPAITVTDRDTTSINPEDQVKFTGSYDDYINQIKFLGGKTNNHDRLNKEIVYSWNPAIDFDKLVNYREYYWMPEGPNAIEIDSVGTGAVAEYKVEAWPLDGSSDRAYKFRHKENERNPILTLYRGNTYRFNIQAKGHNFWIMTEPYKDKVSADGSTSTIYDTGVTNNGTDDGIVTFTIPTGAPDVLYYQCGHHDAMYGVIQVSTIDSTSKINPDDDIIGATNYSLRTLDLSNGMKIKFANEKVAETYRDKEYYVEGVGDAITLTDVTDLFAPASYSTETTILYDSVAFDSRPYAKAFYRPDTPDYMTIKRDSKDQNAWSRYNRWFHKSVIERTAEVNGYTPVLDETARAKRPIIEFDSGLSLYNHGNTAKKSVTLVDTVTTDALSTVVNATGFIIDGVSLQDEMRVMFLADNDPLVKGKIYDVEFVQASDSTKVISLTEASDGTPSNGESVFIEFGTDKQGTTYYYDGDTSAWKEAQQKTKVNQQPLFGMWDENHTSLDDETAYPNSSFRGAKLFAYATSDSATTDTVLGIKVKYNTINNTGDIVFESDHTNGTFTYKQGAETITQSLAQSHLHYTTGLTTHNSRNAWIARTDEMKQRVIRTFIVDGTETQLFAIDFFKNSAELTDLEISVSVNAIRKTINTDYTLVNGTTNKFVKFAKKLSVEDQVKIVGYSSADKVDGKGIYETPANLVSNTLNETKGSFTFGEILGHVKDIFEKNTDITGSIPGPCTLRDKPNARLKGGTIQQHGGPLAPAVFSLIDQESNFINALDYCNLEYQKWYDSFLTQATGTAFEGVAADRVDEIIANISNGRDSTFPFYYEDMSGHGDNFVVRNITVSDSSQTEYALESQFDITTTSNRAVYIYLNDTLLVLGEDYTFSTTDDSVTITKALTAGDKIKIKDYPDTTGSYIPLTPTKLGMYPKFKPEVFSDDTYITTTSVIRKHDGSIIKAYGDERDDLILELEKRIYNNIKTTYDSTTLDINDVMPTVFTGTDYTLQEVNDIMAPDFYGWAGRNNVQYINNTQFEEGSVLTYNYAKSTDRVNSKTLPGYWRGIFKYFYDTDAPHVRPWEMLGHSEKPSDWEDTYGPAPYTSANDVLWNAVATQAGRYGKPGIKDYLPVDASGNLLNPITAGLVENFDIPGRQAHWKFGDHAPAETAWRRSSAYPFTVLKTLSLTKPAKFFGQYFDVSRLTKNVSGNVIYKDTGVRLNLGDAKYHLQTVTDNSTGVTTRYMTSGYQNFVVNHLVARNLDPATFYYDKMQNLQVQLLYKLGGFTDKQNLRILTDSVSPGSTGGSRIIPDENYKILFRTSNPVDTFNYSGVLIEKNTDVSVDGSTLAGGYKVVGYSTYKPFFEFYYPNKGITGKNVSVTGSVQVVEYPEYQTDLQTIPYGYVFDTAQQVVDFLFGYGKRLEERGFGFNQYSRQIKETLNWRTAVREFLYWTTQNWAPGSAVTVSPAADGFTLETANSTVGKMRNLAGDYSLLDAGGRKIEVRDISTKRLGKTFDLSVKNDETGLYHIALNTVQKEHVLIFDNKTVFNDIIFEPFTGFRQQRLKLVGWKTANWNGDYYAPGFIFDSAQVTTWTANTDYKIGDTVEHQGKFYVSKTNHNSGSTFVSQNWILKSEKPAPQLIPNFEYKISQFNDFYNLETNNFDESQEQLAQRLIGYQNRPYLENLFTNEISEYKFYQGFIREKGTKSAIDKILKAKYEESDINLDTYPEWMIRVGDFGNVDAKEHVQLRLDDSLVVANPQSIELLDNTAVDKEFNRSIGIVQDSLYEKPVEYTASTTFDRYDYTNEAVDRDQVQVLNTAGYPQVSQVQHTAFSINDLLNLDVTRSTVNDLIWIANKTNNDWDVLRMSYSGFNIDTISPTSEDSELEIKFNASHGLNAGTSTSMADYFAITNAQNDDLNRVYVVKRVKDYQTVIVDYSGSFSFLPALDDNSTADSFGNVYKFISVRVSTMDNANARLKYNDYNDKNDEIDLKGDKLFCDSDREGKWCVFEKQHPYTDSIVLSPAKSTDQDFGHRIVARNDGRTVVIAAPNAGQGTIHFLFRSDASPGSRFITQASLTMTDNDDNTSRLGESLSISSDENFVVAGAPYTNTLGLDGSTRFYNSGLAKIFVWDPSTFKYGLLNTITPPSDGSSENEDLNFGWAHKICEPGASSVRTTPTKYLFVSAPGYADEAGQVYMYEWGIGEDGSTYDTWTQNLTIESPDKGTGKRFGHRLVANDNGDILAISSVSPGDAGKVEIFVRSSQSSDDSVDHSFTHVQTLTGVATEDSTLNTDFGDSIAMSKDGTTLVIGAPGFDDSSAADAGAVYYYKWNADGSTNTFTLQQTITSPDKDVRANFGSSVDINDDGTRIVIGAKGSSSEVPVAIDSGATTFDLQDTGIVDRYVDSGGAYTATMYNTRFVIDDRLYSTTLSANDDFGKGVCITNNSVFVGAPKDDANQDPLDLSSKISNDGSVSLYDLNKAGDYAWKSIAKEENFIDITKLGQVFDFDSGTKQVRDYYDLYDPIKGRILGIADREINFKTPWDPAVYNAGEQPDANVNPWNRERIGQVWWDLSAVKWLWYEQGTQEYKVNNWGKTFPGSSIDVYEWIESTFLPSEYAQQSGTVGGNQLGLSGTPKHADDSQYAEVRRYNEARNQYVTYYYYWVKNRTTLPVDSSVLRKNTTAYVANIIQNPTQSGIKHYAITDRNKILLWNTGQLINDQIVLNVDSKKNNFSNTAHSVYKIVREGDPLFRPNTEIETRWWDSLIGQNSTGQLVPDPMLPVNEKYGNKVRPRQSWYIDRYAALKEIIDFSNNEMKKYQLAGQLDLSNLNSEDPEPTAGSLEWDATVDTYAELTYINTGDLSGNVNYLVKADETANGFWAIYQWDGTEWTRTKTQTFNTSKFWSYVDWYKVDGDMTHDENTRIDKQVTYEYELDTLDIAVGKHVKVTSADTGGWKLFMKTATGWENVGTENGTIRISTKLYDYSQDATGFAGGDNFDDNFFDEEPKTETRKVLTALRDNIFVNELAINYNTLFFTGLRRVLTEQTYVDWMFKTAFINIKSSVRELDQRKTYTTGTDSWIEEYIDEVKPFHTKVREYRQTYNNVDTQDGLFTDFDNPTFYDSDDRKIRPVNVVRDELKLSDYPWKMWNDYHKKHVSTITVTSGGEGYTTAPTVTIVGGTVGSTGPFQILGTSASGSTSGSYGFYYPLFTSQQKAEIWDSQNGGSGTAHSHTFDEYSGTFYMPSGTTFHAVTSKSGAYKMYDTPDTNAAKATAVVKDGAVTSITVTDKGSNYNSTPTVIISGGTESGANPATVAKAYANLNNDLVRDIDTTIKFDRIKSTSDVVDWESNTSYAYGTLIRYNNELYKASDHFTSTTKFKDNEGKVAKLRGDETGLTASDRTKGFYAPTSGMPGNELSQIMKGVDYGGTMVTGLLFSQDQGWDKANWFDFGFDNYGESDVVTFRGDGSTTTFTFATAPDSTKVYQVYTTVSQIRTKTTNTFRGDGSTTQFTLTTAPADGTLVEFIPFDSDGVLTPTDDRTLDSLVSGGLFGSAVGVAPSDIVMDGDEFVSPDTSYAPEEVVPGQMFDTVDIKVYTSPESGVPFITEKTYLGDNTTTTFALGEHPGTLGSVTVSVDGVVQKINTDYTVDVGAKTITFTTTPTLGQTISTRTFAISGENYRVLDQYRGDGSTIEYTTSTRGEFNLDSSESEIYVTINGIPATEYSVLPGEGPFTADDTRSTADDTGETADASAALSGAYTKSVTANTVKITFRTAPGDNEFIQVAGFNKSSTSTRSYAAIRTQDINYGSGTQRYPLTYPPGSIGPFSALTMIELNGKVLRGPDNTYYLGDGSTYTYGVASGLGDDSTVDPAKTITSQTQVEVYVNGVKKDFNTHYTVDITNQNVEFRTDQVPTAADVIAITTLVDNHYKTDGSDFILDTTQISTDGYSLSNGDVMTATTFNNALGMKQRREVLEGRPSGVFNLRFKPLNATYTYVWLNGEQLKTLDDYTVSDTTITVTGRTITSSDRLDVMYFAIESAVGATGFRIFKDMLNRTFYKRISKTSTTVLSDDVVAESKSLQVSDGTVLPEPDATNNIPGVIFVDKERIEYFTKSGDTLSQLKRGTLGTGIKEHRAGAEVVDASVTQTIPYADTVYTNTFTGDGSTATFNLSQAPSSVSQLDIFIGGQRLLLTSEDGSTINYSVDGSTTAVTLSTAPASGTQVKILYKKGQVWYTGADGNPADGKGLQASTTTQAKFIAGEPTNAPE